MNTGASCQPYVAPGALAALYFQRKDAVWQLGSCSSAPLGEALQLAQGDPMVAEGGPPVAYVAGGYGRGRVTAVDREGRAVAWDRTAGSGGAVAVCPGGRTVVVAGRTAGKGLVRAEGRADRPRRLDAGGATDGRARWVG